MNKKTTYIIWFILLATTISSLYLVLSKPNDVVITPEQNFGGVNYFMKKISQCPNNVSVSDQFGCLHKLAEATTKEADELAEKLISQSPIRLKEITEDITKGPETFAYGGADFLTVLPIQVKKAQEVKDQYIGSVCNLTSMTIFGGSEMDLEQNACNYYYTNEYLQILKSLEPGLNIRK
jgi:hypothetical protein